MAFDEPEADGTCNYSPSISFNRIELYLLIYRPTMKGENGRIIIEVKIWVQEIVPA